MSESKVAVLLCTYWPDNYLDAQLQSIARQTLPPDCVWISDDTADWKTREIIRSRAEENGLMNSHILAGPQRGFAANFISLLVRSEVDGDFFAFSDQDDIWLEDKLEVAVQRLKEIPPNIPGVYCSRTLLVNEENSEIGLSAPCNLKPSFANALVQSLAGGNTMVLNEAARDLVISAGQSEVVSHDWWIYMLVSGVGGEVIFDDKPRVRYRQHQTNIIGSNTSISGQLIRVKMLFRNRYKDWNHRNLSALQSVRHLLLPENQRKMDLFITARSGSLFQRVSRLKSAGVFRQTRIGTLALYLATVFGKI